MKKKIVVGLFIILLVLTAVLLLYGQGNSIYLYRFLQPVGGANATGSTIFYNTSNVAASYASISWTVNGTLSGCTIQVNNSINGTTVAGQLISSQTCTSNGSFIAGTTSSPLYVQAAYTITPVGSGYLNFVVQGCLNSTCTAGSGGGSGTVNTGTTPQLGYYAASGTAISPDPGVSDSTGTGSLVLGGAGVGAGNITLDGSTSGSVTLSCNPANTCTSFTSGKLFDLSGQCKIGSAGVTLSTSVTTICSFGSIGGSSTWSFMCSGTYTITAGTTPTFGLGIGYTQTPTSETGNARIASALNPIVESAGSLTATTTGNQSILTGATVTTITSAPWSASGTIQASATAGSFTIFGILGGTTPAGTVNPGSTCFMY
jgi:hypothetical protein